MTNHSPEPSAPCHTLVPPPRDSFYAVFDHLGTQRRIVDPQDGRRSLWPGEPVTTLFEDPFDIFFLQSFQRWPRCRRIVLKHLGRQIELQRRPGLTATPVYQGPLHDILQFPNIARPAVGIQLTHLIL